MDNIAWYCYVIIIITARTIISIISMFTQLQHTAAALPLVPSFPSHSSLLPFPLSTVFLLHIIKLLIFPDSLSTILSL